MEEDAAEVASSAAKANVLPKPARIRKMKKAEQTQKADAEEKKPTQFNYIRRQTSKCTSTLSCAASYCVQVPPMQSLRRLR